MFNLKDIALLLVGIFLTAVVAYILCATHSKEVKPQKDNSASVTEKMIAIDRNKTEVIESDIKDLENEKEFDFEKLGNDH